MQAIIFACIFWALLIFICVITFKGIRRSKSIQTWPVVMGEITLNEEAWESDGDSTFLKLTLLFSYEIDGILYSSGVKFHLNNSLGLNSHLSKLVVGTKVEVLYNPSNKQDSVLKKFDQNMSYEPLIFAYLIFMLAILTTWIALS